MRWRWVDVMTGSVARAELRKALGKLHTVERQRDVLAKRTLNGIERERALFELARARKREVEVLRRAWELFGESDVIPDAKKHADFVIAAAAKAREG